MTAKQSIISLSCAEMGQLPFCFLNLIAQKISV